MLKVIELAFCCCAVADMAYARKFGMEQCKESGCRMAMIFDPDGNTICIHKRNTR